MIIQFEISERLYNFLQKRIELGCGSELDLLINKGKVIDKDCDIKEPREVLYSGDGYADGKMVYDMAECPNCGYEYEVSDWDWKEPFCPHCGQHLEWENEE